MMEDAPMTVAAWEVYVSDLDRESLWRQGRVVNTRSFVQRMLAEGHDMDGVRQIVLFFTRAMVLSEMKLPEGGPFDLVQMAEQDPLLRSERGYR